MPFFHLSLPRLRFRAVLAFSASALYSFLPLSLHGAPQAPADGKASAIRQSLPPTQKPEHDVKAEAYYHFSLGHLYEELAGSYGNRSDYVNKAIENYRLAMKEDPGASFLVEDVAELYRASGRLREAVEEAQAALKANPDDLNARRVLARIYTQQIGDAQANHVDENMVRKAVEQYKLVTDKDPNDLGSFVMLGRLQKLTNDSVDAEAAFKKALTLDPDSEEAVSGLAGVYADRGDLKGASDLLQKLADKSPSPRSLVALAELNEQMRQFGPAADAYGKVLELDPNRVEIRPQLAQDQALAGRLNDALSTYRDMSESNPQDPQAFLGMAQIFREQKKLPESRQALEKAKQLSPDNVEIRYNEVGLLQDEGKTPDAINALKAILDSTARKTYDTPQKAMRSKMLEELGFLYRSNEQYESAISTFRQIPALEPDSEPRAEAQVIDTYRLAKDYPKAQAESTESLKKYPKDLMLAQVRAQLYADQGQTNAAVAELKKALNGTDDLKIYLATAEVYEKAKDWPQMEKALETAETLHPEKDDKATLLFMRGTMYERQKKFDQAEKVFRQVLDSDPNNSSALNYLGYMLADQSSRLQEAQDFVKRAVTLEPNNYAFLDSLGWVYYRQGRLEDAETQLKHSLQLMSKDPTIHDHLGDVFFKQGKLKDAIDQWQSSIKAFSSSPQADAEPDEAAKVQKKLDGAKVRLAKEQQPARNSR